MCKKQKPKPKKANGLHFVFRGGAIFLFEGAYAPYPLPMPSYVPDVTTQVNSSCRQICRYAYSRFIAKINSSVDEICDIIYMG